jgi:hypothetical protein
VRIGIHRPERQPGEEPDRPGDLRLHEIAHVAADLGIEVRTNRLMDGTHPERLGVWEQGLILESRVEHHLPGGQHAQPAPEPWALPDDILVHLQAKAPGVESRRTVHQMIGIIPAPRRKPHPTGRGEPPVRGLEVWILALGKAIAKRRNPSRSTNAWISSVVGGRGALTRAGAAGAGDGSASW